MGLENQSLQRPLKKMQRKQMRKLMISSMWNEF
jgi:hypothetical protein